MTAAVKKIPVSPVESLIYLVRNQKVMLDEDLANLYGVLTKSLNRAVKRNISRFPPEFMFQLTPNETERLRYQTGTSKKGRGGRRYLPYAFTEYGVVMLSYVLNSERAVQVSLIVVRAFIRMRGLMSKNKELAVRIEKLEHGHGHIDSVIEVLVEDIERLSKDIRWIKNPPLKPKHRIGFYIDKEPSE